jgi:putative tryptophan/tyrosine transport system substrate-binding protein
MRRREFITLLGGAAAAWPAPAWADQARKLSQIGVLGVTSHAEFRLQVDALRSGLRQAGYEEGKNIVIHYRWPEGRYDRLPELAADLVKLDIDVLVVVSTPGARAAKQATSTVPIVMAAVGDPVAAGLVASLARPGGNLTGLTFFFAEICAKRVELIREMIPALTRLAVIVNPANPSHPIALDAMQETARAFGIELVPAEVRRRDDVAAAIAAIATRQIPALVAIEDPLVDSNARQIAHFALQQRLPMIGFSPQAEAGALMEYGVNLLDLWFRSAAFIDKILKGTPPGNLPIERAVKFELIVNLNTAKALGLEIPPTLIACADKVIE